MINKVFYIIVGIQVTSGVMLTIFLKLMDKQIVNGKPFQHAYLQTCISFIGQTFNFALYYYQKFKQGKEKEEQPKIENDQNITDSESKTDSDKSPLQRQTISSPVKIPYIKLLRPAIFHGTCSMCGYAAYFHMPASLSMMMAGALPLITAILSYFILGKKILKHHKLGMAVIMFGSIVLGGAAMSSDEVTPNANPVLGVFLSLLSLLLFGCLMISEEILLVDYSIPTTLLAGFEGLFALCLSIICIPILNTVSSNLIDTSLFFSQMGSSSVLVVAAVGLLISDMLYTLFCIILTKHASAMTRSIIFQLRCIGVWILALCLPNPKSLGGGQWENFDIVQLMGYVMLGIGVFIFQEFIVIKHYGFDSDISLKYEEEIPDIQGQNNQNSNVNKLAVSQENAKQNSSSNVNNDIEYEDNNQQASGRFSIE